MQVHRTICRVFLSITMVPLAAQAQNPSSAALALSLTPAGALPAGPFLPRTLRPDKGWQVRYGRAETDGTPLSHLGASYVGTNPMGGATSFTVGTTLCSGCDRSLMLGAETDVPLSSDGALIIALRPGVGAMKDFGLARPSALSATLSLPISAVLQGSGRMAVVPFIDPGVGVGLVYSEFGFRPLLGGGIAFVSNRGGVHVSAKRVMYEFAKTQFGVGVTMPIGRKS